MSNTQTVVEYPAGQPASDIANAGAQDHTDALLNTLDHCIEQIGAVLNSSPELMATTLTHGEILSRANRLRGMAQRAFRPGTRLKSSAVLKTSLSIF